MHLLQLQRSAAAAAEADLPRVLLPRRCAARGRDARMRLDSPAAAAHSGCERAGGRAAQNKEAVPRAKTRVAEPDGRSASPASASADCWNTGPSFRCRQLSTPRVLKHRFLHELPQGEQVLVLEAGCGRVQRLRCAADSGHAFCCPAAGQLPAPSATSDHFSACRSPTGARLQHPAARRGALGPQHPSSSDGAQAAAEG